jgi:uncharacterized protein YndB with AHSA1/START domain
VLRAAPARIYRALLDPAALAAWLPPAGMTCAIERFEPRVGGRYRMVLTYQGAAHTPGKSSPHADVVEGEFVELVPDGRVVQGVVFESDDPAFAGAMNHHLVGRAGFGRHRGRDPLRGRARGHLPGTTKVLLNGLSRSPFTPADGAGGLSS